MYHYTYKPVQFFLIVFLITWIFGFAAAYFSYQVGKEKIITLCLMLGLLAPISALSIMLMSSRNQALMNDFWNRLSLPSLNTSFTLSLCIMPIVLILATSISLLCGYSADQFSFSKELNVLQGQGLLSFCILLLAPTLEEIGWRGYGVDSLHSYYTIFIATIILAGLLALWHLPLFFIKGYYQYQLWHTNTLYALNFFVSIVPATILLNWVYYTNNRNIIAVIIFHFNLNLFSVLCKTEQFTKCILTMLLCIISLIVILYNKELFFNKQFGANL